MKRTKKSRTSNPIWFLIIVLLSLLLVIILHTVLVDLATQSFGPPSEQLSDWQRFNYSFQLLWNSSDLLSPDETNASEQAFIVQPGESASTIAQHLEDSGYIPNAEIFKIYLLWSGMDTSIQSGTYYFDAGLSGIDLALALQDPKPADVVLVILPGWRYEEIAAVLAISGLSITSSDFLATVENPSIPFDYLQTGMTLEGFLFPGQYTLPRSTTVQELVSVLLSSFSRSVTNDLIVGFRSNGLDVYSAVILASIIEREAVMDDEMPLIASVFYNRLAINMKLESDPTVQYALGYNALQGTWWTNPLQVMDLGIASPYNTYTNYGLPPGPISNPGLSAIYAVAYPAQTPYFFFMARCDGSGYHNFAETYAEHTQNICK